MNLLSFFNNLLILSEGQFTGSSSSYEAYRAVSLTFIILMGVAAYLVWRENGPGRKSALTLYGVQLIFNFLWTIIFFNMAWYGFALLWLIILWGLILATLLRFWRENATAGKLMVPYLLWVTFAAYLNAGVWYLN